MVWSNYWLVQATFVGLLLGVGFVIPPLWFLSIIAIAWMLHQLTKEQSVISWKFVLVVWFVKYLLALSWFWSVYPIDWLDTSSNVTELLVIGLYWVSASLWLSLGGAVLFFCILFLQKKNAKKYILITAPAIWLMAELLGALLFSIMTYGPGGQLTTQFSFGFVGYHLAQHGLLIQLAGVAGVYGLSVALVTLAIVIVYLWQHNKRNWTYALVLTLLVTSFIQIPFAAKEVTSQYTVAVVDTWYPNNSWLTDDGREEMQQQNKAALDAALTLGADYILFPEGSQVFNQSVATSTLRAMLQFQYGSNDVVIIDSGRVSYEDRVILQSVAFDSSSASLEQSQKQYLVPQGEYIPTLYAGVMRLFGFSDTVEYLEERLAYQVGEKNDMFTDSLIPPVLFCFESVAPSGVRTLVSNRTNTIPFVAHVVSHGWFNEPEILWQQLESMLRIQAIWNDVHIVVAGNHTAGYVVDPTGSITKPTEKTSGQYWRLGIVTISN